MNSNFLYFMLKNIIFVQNSSFEQLLYGTVHEFDEKYIGEKNPHNYNIAR